MEETKNEAIDETVLLTKTPTPKSPKSKSPSIQVKSPQKSPSRQPSPSRSISYKSGSMLVKSPQNIADAVYNLEPRGMDLSDHINELTETVNKLSRDISSPLGTIDDSNVDKIANMSKVLTDEASALRQSIRVLSEDIVKTKQLITGQTVKEDVNFPYHLFLIEIIINKIHMKCDCFDLDFNNMVITATFLGKQPVALYDSSYGMLHDLNKINVGKSILFAMTYDKICSIKEFEVAVELTKQPPCSPIVQRIGETKIDYTNEFNLLREELCDKWKHEQPNDSILCTSSSPLTKNMYYLTCGDVEHPIGVIEMSTRMSFLGKEITTAFSGAPRPQGTSAFSKNDRGMSMYACQNVEMDDQGKVLLDEEVLRRPTCQSLPLSDASAMSPVKKGRDPYCNSNYDDGKFFTFQFQLFTFNNKLSWNGQTEVYFLSYFKHDSM